MKALVLCGGIPQIELIKQLKDRGIYTILADMNDKVMAREYADEFYPVSVLDVERVKELAQRKKVDMVLTACADQVLEVQAHVSEMLGLPCYIDYETAKRVSSKELMKKVFFENDIPSSKYVIMSEFDEGKVRHLQYPIIVKPVDSYSSKGVRKVLNHQELAVAFDDAVHTSRCSRVIVEEYVEGKELTVDVYVENGKARVLCVSNIDKIPGNDRFVICRTRYPADISEVIKNEVGKIANKISMAFELKDSPMLIQAIVNGDRLSVVEFCARTGGGDKFKLVKQVSGFDVIKAVIDLTLGDKPHVEEFSPKGCIVNEFLYAKQGVFDHVEGFEKMKAEGFIHEYFELKAPGTECGEIKSSGDRVAYYTVTGKNTEEVQEKDKMINRNIKLLSNNAEDLMRHDLVGAV